MKTRLIIFVGLFFSMMTAGYAATNMPGVTPGNGASYLIAARRSRYQGDVYLLRGLANVFSLGLDTLGDKLLARGINAKVVRNSQWRVVTNTIIRNQKKYGRSPVVLIGHSYGADAVINIARELQRRRIRVSYAVTFEPTVRARVPSNIRVFVNYYLSNSSFGVALQKARRSRGYFRNVDMISARGVNHFNIEEQASLHRKIIRNVLRFVRPKKRRKTALLH